MSTSSSNLGYAMLYDYDRHIRNHTALDNTKHSHSLDRMLYNGEVLGLYGTVRYANPQPVCSPLDLFNIKNNKGGNASYNDCRGNCDSQHMCNFCRDAVPVAYKTLMDRAKKATRKPRAKKSNKK